MTVQSYDYSPTYRLFHGFGMIKPILAVSGIGVLAGVRITIGGPM